MGFLDSWDNARLKYCNQISICTWKNTSQNNFGPRKSNLQPLLRINLFFRNVETWPQCKFLKVYCPQISIKIRLLHSYLAGDLLNSTNFVLLLLVNEMGTPRIPKLNAIIRIDMHKKLVFSNSNRLWIKALQLRIIIYL